MHALRGRCRQRAVPVGRLARQYAHHRASFAGDRVLVCYPGSAGGGSDPGQLVFAARDLRRGRPLWQRWIDENVISAPVVSGNNVYFATFAGTLSGFRLSDGEVELARRCRATSAPIVVNEAIYISRRVDGKGDQIPSGMRGIVRSADGEAVLASPEASDLPRGSTDSDRD